MLVNKQLGISRPEFHGLGDDILRITRQHKERSRQYAESLIGLPFSCLVISGKEFGQLKIINYWLKKIMEQCEKEFTSQSHDSRKTLRGIEMGIIPEVMRELDELDVWTCKFSTGNPKISCNDSVYYMTASGVSLRLKMAARYEEGERIIQPLMENIHFLGSDKSDLSEDPKMEYITIEYATQDFLEMLTISKAGSDYHSTIRIYNRNGKIEIPKHGNIKYSHGGNPVNHIYFIRQR